MFVRRPAQRQSSVGSSATIAASTSWRRPCMCTCTWRTTSSSRAPLHWHGPGKKPRIGVRQAAGRWRSGPADDAGWHWMVARGPRVAGGYSGDGHRQRGRWHRGDGSVRSAVRGWLLSATCIASLAHLACGGRSSTLWRYPAPPNASAVCLAGGEEVSISAAASATASKRAISTRQGSHGQVSP